jgi:membrane protein
MESSMDDPNQRSDLSETTGPRYKKVTAAWHAWYEGTFAQDLFRGLGAVDFADRIIIFGACLLISVLPLIIVLSAYADHQIQEDIAQRLGLNGEGTTVIEGLFTPSVGSFSLSIFLSLLLSFAGTMAVARSVEVIYERAFDHPPLARGQGWLRSLVWVVVISGVLIGDGVIDKPLRGDAGPVVFGLVEFVIFTLFFWWSIHFLLGGREGWRRVRPAAIATGLLWIGLGVSAAFYGSLTIVNDSKTYGTIGVTFTLVTWFIAIGAVLTLGAVVGAVWRTRRGGTPRRPDRKPAPLTG